MTTTNSTMKLIQKTTLTASVGSVTLGTGGTIPQTYTDLFIVMSVRSDRAAVVDQIRARFNGEASDTNNSGRFLAGDSGSVSGGTDAFFRAGYAAGASVSSSTFASSDLYIANYTGSAVKDALGTSVLENNSTSAAIVAVASKWNNSAAITSIVLYPGLGTNFVSGSTIYLYGVSRVTSGVVASGGTVTDSGGYRYHTFTSTSSFVVSTPGTVEYLVVGGGGGGPSGSYGGGGGAGGLLSGALSVTAQTYTVTIGGGGAGSTAGSNSVFAGRTAIGGGKGNDTTATVPAGGSGGGGAPSSFGAGATAGLGTAGQGNPGGNGTTGNSNTGGGGGAGAAGAAGSGSVGGAGGAGASVFGTVYAGGGAGAGSSATVSTGGSGGGGNTGQPGTANRGGGGGGSYAGGASAVGGAGGSGIVIIRYPV